MLQHPLAHKQGILPAMCITLSCFLNHKKKCDPPWLIGYMDFIQAGRGEGRGNIPSSEMYNGLAGHSRTVAGLGLELTSFQPKIHWVS